MITHKQYKDAQNIVDQYKSQEIKRKITNIANVSEKDVVLEWWQELIENDLCDFIEKKHGFYGHDIGTSESDIIKMYEMEFN